MALAKLEANIGSIVVTSKGVFTVESINTAQTKEGTSTSISGHSRSGRFFSIEGEEGTYKVIANPTIEQVNEAYARERQLEQLVNNVHAYEETPIVSRYYSQNPNTKLTLTLITPNAVNGTRAKMGKLERELNALREWVMERYLEYTSEVAAALEAHRNPVSPEKLINTTFANVFFSEEGAATPALFGSYYEELVKRINKPGRYHYSEERAESHAEEAVNNAIFEALSEIDKGIMGARQVTRQVENFYAGK